MTDYTINERTGHVIKNRDKEDEAFSDTYHFVRQGNQWLLDNIKNKVSYTELKLQPHCIQKVQDTGNKIV